jgi:hypothetical protein
MVAEVESMDFLIDAPEDGWSEEWMWVSVDVANSAEEAAAWALTNTGYAIGEDLTVVAHGARVWQRPLGKLDPNGEWRVPCQDCRDLPQDDCGVCDGSDLLYDYCPFETCESNADGAREFWVLELIEKEQADD